MVTAIECGAPSTPFEHGFTHESSLMRDSRPSSVTASGAGYNFTNGKQLDQFGREDVELDAAGRRHRDDRLPLMTLTPLEQLRHLGTRVASILVTMATFFARGTSRAVR
jgi:hypothetical protein